MSKVEETIANETAETSVLNINNDVVKKKELCEEDVTNFLVHVKNGLSQIEKTLTGDGYAFCSLNCENQNIEIIAKEIERYKYLKYINMSKNKIQNIENVCLLPHILFLDLSFNLIPNLTILKNKKYLPFCMYLNVSNNTITQLEDIKLKKLIELDLSHNQISDFNISLPRTLKKLILSNNSIKILNIKNQLRYLEFLDLSSNPLEHCNFFEIAPNLVFLKINNISTLTEEHIKFLNNLKSLQYLEIQNFLPFQEKSEKEVKKIVLANMPDVHLIKLNKKQM